MIRWCAIGCLALSLAAAPLCASARPATQPARCPVAVYAVVPVPAAAHSTYAAFLESPDGPGVVSGTLWVNTATHAYHVRVDQRTAVSPAQSGPYEPVVFQLPAAESPQSVFVDSLDSPDPGPCTIADVWLAKPGNQLKPGVGEALQAALASAAAPEPAAAIDAPAAECKSGNTPPAVLAVNKPTGPPPGGFLPGPVTVLVRLGEDSSVLSATVEHAPGMEDNAGALEVARHAVYRTGYVDCRPHVSDFRLNIQF